MDIRNLIEEINALSEDELVDEFEAPSIEDTEIIEAPSTTNSLEAKTRVSRAFDTLKDALEYFKDITSEELDLIQDSMLNSSIEQLSDDIWAIESCLNNKSIEPSIESEEDKVEDKVEEVESDDHEELFDQEAEFDLFDTEDQD